MPHDENARREAGAVPLILFGDHGRTVDHYLPASEDLTGAQDGKASGGRWRAVRGPHLRSARRQYARNSTGIVGISICTSRVRRCRYYVVNLGSTCRRFNIKKLGRIEALRRALSLRQRHLEKLALANAAIIRARMQSAAKGAA